MYLLDNFNFKLFDLMKEAPYGTKSCKVIYFLIYALLHLIRRKMITFNVHSLTIF